MHLTFDIFSGRANPSWRLPVAVARTVVDLIADNGLLPPASSALFPSRLGYRGLQIVLPPEIVSKYHLSPWLNLSADALGHISLFKDFAAITQAVGFLGFTEFQKLVQSILGLLQKPLMPAASKLNNVPTGPCAFEMLPFEPKPWNEPAFKANNNCYAYAANKRAAYPSKPQPGIGSGAMFSSLTGEDVAAATKRDGAHAVNDCFSDKEAPRMLVALVIWPGNDYHWYRKHPNCWGHKPGSTDARNVDSSGAVITNPETCNRGPYTEFYGYMLMPKSQKVAAA